MSVQEGEYGTWSHCGKRAAHGPHLHSFAMNEGRYDDVLCHGTRPEPQSEPVLRQTAVESALRDTLREMRDADLWMDLRDGPEDDDKILVRIDGDLNLSTLASGLLKRLSEPTDPKFWETLIESKEQS